MLLGSHFDGISAFPYAASFYGIKAIWATEIEPFPVSVSKHHFPHMRHYGDISMVNGAELEPVDIITFGSPCQDLSVAGKREGLYGQRSGLFMEAIRTIREMREATNGAYPRYAIWENVPGAFSSNRGLDFKAVLEEITETEIPMPRSGKWATAGMVRGNGRSVAWRVLDAQYWGVPQRRRRIFLVADFAGQRAPEILFERQSMCWNSQESGKAREEVAAGAGDGVKTAESYRLTEFGRYIEDDCASPVKARDYKDATDLIAVTLTGEDKARCLTARADSSPCVDRGQNVVAAPQLYDMTHAEELMRPVTPGLAPTLNARMGTSGNQVPVMMQPIAFNGRQDPVSGKVTGALDTYGATQCIAFQPGNLSRRAGAEPSEKAFPTLGATTQGDQFPHIAIGFNGDQSEKTRSMGEKEEQCLTLRAGGANHVAFGPGGSKKVSHTIRSQPSKADKPSSTTYICEPIAYPDPANTLRAKSNLSFRGDADNIVCNQIAPTIPAREKGGGGLGTDFDCDGGLIKVGYAVRRLTPTECERLMGFPDGWTDGGSDTARYKALGNSIAVPCLKWIFSQLVK